MVIDLKLTDRQKQMVKEFWPCFSYFHDTSIGISYRYIVNTDQWKDIKGLAEEAFMLGREVGRQEMKEHIEQSVCDHRFVYSTTGGECTKCGQTSLQCSSD